MRNADFGIFNQNFLLMIKELRNPCPSGRRAHSTIRNWERWISENASID